MADKADNEKVRMCDCGEGFVVLAYKGLGAWVEIDAVYCRGCRVVIE